MKLLPVSLVAPVLLPTLFWTALADPCDPDKHMFGVSDTIEGERLNGQKYYKVFGIQPGKCENHIWTIDGSRGCGMNIPNDNEGKLVCLEDGQLRYEHPIKGSAVCDKVTGNKMCKMDSWSATESPVTHCCRKLDVANAGSNYNPGWCGVHVRQVQKGSAKNQDYILEVWIYDAKQNEIGKLTGDRQAPAGVGVGATSRLPWVLIVTPQLVDKDPLKFAYGGQFWESSSGQCSVGAYDKGARYMDCGFTCT